jgi:leader peptidase (prepilin peptidase)/N-methyltransferase
VRNDGLEVRPTVLKYAVYDFFAVETRDKAKDFMSVIAELPMSWDPWSPATWCFAFWLLCLGACVGSFLNVVIYRVPAGQSIVRPGSRCPQCGHAIRWYDNVPVVSWCLLRARCRDCGAAIAIRYPLIESLVAGIFLGLGVVEVFGAGANLPSPADGQWPASTLIGIHGYHALLVTTLLAIAVINFDGHLVGWKFVLPPLLVGVVAPAVFPRLHPVPLWPGLGEGAATWSLLLGLGGSGAGAAAGLAAGLLTFPLLTAQAGRAPQTAGCGSIVPATTLTGAFLGWPAIVGIVAITAVVFPVVPAIARWLAAARRVPWTCLLFAVTLFWILGWRHLFEPLTYVQWLRPQIAVYLGVVIVCASALARICMSGRGTE